MADGDSNPVQRLRRWLWLLPVVAFIVVLTQQVFEHTVLWGWPRTPHFLSQMAFYGVVAPLVAWFALSRLLHTVEQRQRAQAERERAHGELESLYEFSRRAAAIAEWDQLLELIVQTPRKVVPCVGTSLILTDHQGGDAAMVAADGLSQAYVGGLRARAEAGDDVPCLTCSTLRTSWFASCPMVVPQAAGEGVSSLICLPLTRGERRIGMLTLHRATDASLDEESKNLLSALASEMSGSLESLRLRTREVRAFYEVQESLRREIGLDRLLRSVLSEAIAVGEAEGGAILLRGRDGRFEPKVGWGAWDDYPREDRSLLEALVGSTAEGRETLSLGDISRDVQNDPVASHRIASALCAPLVAEGEVLGTILLAHSRPNRFSPRVGRFLGSIAGQLALVVRNAELIARLQHQAVLEERARLAREMHDGLAQDLGYLSLRTRQIQDWLSRGQGDRARREISEVRRVLADAYADVREAIDGLRIPLEEGSDLAEAVGTYLSRVAESTGLEVRLHAEARPPTRLEPMAQAQVLRIVQEAVTNARKHAHARRIVVQLSPEANGLAIVVEDDGSGFDPRQVAPDDHRGLEIMRERAQGLGGRLTIESAPGAGTRISLRLPEIALAKVVSW